MNGKGLAEGIALGTNIGRTINESLSDRDHLAQQMKQFEQNETFEQAMQQRQFANQQALQAAGFSEESARQAASIQAQKDLQATGIQASADKEDARSKAQLARDLGLQQAIGDRQTANYKAQADYSADKQGHAMQDQFDRFYNTKNQYAQELAAAQQSGNPQSIAQANDKLQSWTQAGASLFAQAHKDSALNYTIDPNDGKLKVTGKVSSPEELQRIQQMLVKPGDDTPEGMLDSAIGDNRRNLTQMQMANPQNQPSWSTWWHGQNPGDRARLEQELQSNLAQRAALSPAPTAEAPDPSMQFGPPPTSIAPAPTAPSAFQSANKYQEGQQAVNPQTGKKMIFHNGAWGDFQ